MKPSICTASGIEFDLADPKPEQVRITDIAHALAHKPRFGGHTSLARPGASREMAFYSVAQHCCWVHDQLRGKERAYGLLHDAAEAYLCDLPAPAKLLCPDFVQVEYHILRAVYRAFALEPDCANIKPAGVAYFDDLAWRAERRELMPPADWWPAEADTPEIHVPWEPHEACRGFLARFDSLVVLGHVKPNLSAAPVSADGYSTSEGIAHV